MGESNLVTASYKIRLTDGTERIHNLQFPSTMDGIEKLLKVDATINTILQNGRFLPFPSPPTFYPVDKIMWVECSIEEDKELQEKVEERRLGFLKS